MRRSYRIALEVLAPAPLGLIVLMLPSMVNELWRTGPSAIYLRWETMAGICLVGLMAYLIAGIPSVIYAWVLEASYRRGLNPASWLAVGWSTILGLLAGSGMILVMAWSSITLDQLVMVGGAGMVTGLLVGFAIRHLTRIAQTQGGSVS